jgi:hypothetical protein
MKVLKFLQWQFEGCYKSAQLYAFGIVALALIAKLGGCPDPWPFRILVTGLAVSLIDTIVWFVRFQYHLYKTEQDRIVRELSRK